MAGDVITGAVFGTLAAAGTFFLGLAVAVSMPTVADQYAVLRITVMASAVAGVVVGLVVADAAEDDDA